MVEHLPHPEGYIGHLNCQMESGVFNGGYVQECVLEGVVKVVGSLQRFGTTVVVLRQTPCGGED